MMYKNYQHSFMAQATRTRRTARVSQMPLKDLLADAFRFGTQPQRYKAHAGIFVQVHTGRKIELVSKHGRVSPAGKIWYEELHQIQPPKLYRYEQPLIDDEAVEAWDGTRIRVRRKNNDGTWTIFKAGEPYFRYNKSEYIVDVPYVMAAKQNADRTWKIKRPNTQRDTDMWYKTIIEKDHYDEEESQDIYKDKSFTVGSTRTATRGRMRARNLQATEEEQKREIKAAASKILTAKPTLKGEDGKDYYIIYVESDNYILWDETRPLVVHEQRTNFWDDRPATTETILGRPLRSFAIPDGFYRSWDLNPDSFKTFTHGCVVQMLYKSITKRPRGKLRAQGVTSRIPMLTIEQIQAKLDTIFTELGYKDGEYPFEAGWKACGANAHMILCFCKSMNIPCYVHHHKDLLTYFAPEETKPGEAIVNVSIHGDHCYFYGANGDKIGICEMNRVASYKANQSPDLAYSNLKNQKEKEADVYTNREIESPFRHEKTPPFSEWRTESQLIASMTAAFADIREEFNSKPGKRKNRTDRETDGLLFWSTDVHQIYKNLKELQESWKGSDNAIDLKANYGSDFYSICSLSIGAHKCPKIKIKGVPKDAELLNRMSISITRQCSIDGRAFIYKGETLSAWMEKLRLLVSKVQRQRFTPEERTIILKKSFYRCAICDEELKDNKYELDHRQPICDGGQDDVENMQPCCLPCHAEKCASERLNIYGKHLYSELNIDTLEGLFDAPKPKQIYFGDGTTNCLEVDIIKCRRFALEKSTFDFPIACVLDNIVPFSGGDFDYAYVDAGEPDLKDYQQYCLYNGPRWYHAEAFHTALTMDAKNGTGERITEDHIVCAFKASFSAPKDTFADLYAGMSEVIEKALEYEIHPESDWVYTTEQKDKFVKTAILAMQGSWLTQHQYKYHIVDSTHTADLKRKLLSFQSLGGFDGLMRIAGRTEILTNRTMALIGLQALNTEHIFMAKAIWLTTTIPSSVKICGAIVDCILLKVRDTEQEQEVKEKFEKLRHADQSIICRVKSKRDALPIRLAAPVVETKASSWTPNYSDDEELTERFNSKSYGNWYSNPRFKYERYWTEIIEEEGVGTCDENDTFQMEVAKEIVKNRGAIVTGCGGSGKSKILEYVEKGFKDEGFATEKCASTHTASANVDGETILRELHKNAQTKRRVFLVDEGSMVSIRLWAALQTLQFTGAVFVVFGDWDGQLSPISDRDNEDIWKQLPTSDFMHQLVNGLYVQVNKYRRGTDVDHYNFVKSIYPRENEEDLSGALLKARLRYPVKFSRFTGTTLCLTNKCRVAINERVNHMLAPVEHRFIKVTPNPRAAKTPQDMRIWPGIVLIGACTDKANVKNAIRYKVLEVAEQSARLTQVNDKDEHIGKEFELTFEEIGQKLLLSHAITYDSSQARTIYGPLMLTQTSHKHMTLRRLIVGLGRAPDGSFVEVE